MKKARPEVRSKKIPAGSVLFRTILCKGIQMALDLALIHAHENRDRDLHASLGRVAALLQHEMRTFLGLDNG